MTPVATTEAEREGADAVRTRPLRWSEYAARRNVPMIRSGRLPGLLSALPGVWSDDLVDPPSEGSIEDVQTWTALLEVLMRHSSSGSETGCIAYFDCFWVEEAPTVLHGQLLDHLGLLADSEYSTSPQILWPDDHGWVLQTGIDDWATTISGETDLVEDLLSAPELEAIRISDSGDQDNRR